MGKNKAPSATYTLRFPALDGTFTLHVTVPRGPMRLRDLVPLAQRVTNINVERSAALEKQAGREVSCKPGCTACCYQLAPISPPEAFRLADHVLALDARTRDAYFARIDAAESAVAAAGLLAELDALAAGEETEGLRTLPSRYLDEHLACPFLSGDLCSVHIERPIVCRNYLVTSPAAWCGEPRLHTIRTVKTPPVLSGALSGAAAALTGGPALTIPLATAMRWVDEHAELGFREWPGVEVMHALLRELGVSDAEIVAIQ